ncbi:MAG: YkgJ family cysteine cluster protein [Vampirovibrionales bacterium]|nr:YkgJ family cysteine cluster protein [Vampirovibrionales bacterium]
MKEILTQLLPQGLRPLFVAPPQSGEVEGQFYKRTGGCNQCGKCCTNIYLIHTDRPIQTEAEFEHLQRYEPEYASFKPIAADEHGLRFQCGHLQPDNTCEIYNERPSFCRKYPSEKGVLLGGQLATGCGYSFEVLQPFQSVLENSNKQPQSKVFELDTLENPTGD